jgi:hypothetical protein
MLFGALFGFLYLIYAWTQIGNAARFNMGVKEVPMQSTWLVSCVKWLMDSPNYREYAMRMHGPLSEGLSSSDMSIDC